MFRLLILRTAAAIALVTVSSCAGKNPESPSTTGLAGNWSGTTFQGRPISFTVSRDNRLTTLSVGYQIDACTGTASFANLDVAVFEVAGAASSGFAYGQTLTDRPDVGVGVQGYLMPNGGVAGTLIVYGKPACGSSEAVAGPFNASRR